MTDPTEAPRRALKAQVDAAAKLLESRQKVEEVYGKVWDTKELLEDYDVLSFLAPFVSVRRKRDSVKGLLMFLSAPQILPLVGTRVSSPQVIAGKLLSHFGDACTDVAYSRPWEESWADPKTKAWAANAERRGVQDLPGAYADHLYNDHDLACDIIGDRLHDECLGDGELIAKVLECLRRALPWMPAKLWKELAS